MKLSDGFGLFRFVVSAKIVPDEIAKLVRRSCLQNKRMAQKLAIRGSKCLFRAKGSRSCESTKIIYGVSAQGICLANVHAYYTEFTVIRNQPPGKPEK